MNIQELFYSLGRERIEQFVIDKQEENLHIEFKTLNTSDLKHGDDKKNLATALSGFANSSGGVVIWGIQARMNHDGIDCASATKPVRDGRMLIARLNQLTGDAVSPIVSGVQHSLHLTSDAACYAATLVPESDGGPHMAKLGEDRYYKRSGDSFYRMEHFDIADMFGRRKRAHLRLTRRIVNAGSIGGGGPTQLKARVVLGIENIGRAAASAPYLTLRLTHPYRVDAYGVDGNRGEGLERIASSDYPEVVRYGANAGIVVHPNTVREVALVEMSIAQTWDGTVRRLRLPPDLVVAFEIAAVDAPLESGVLTVRAEEVREALLPGE